jgi:hypothetical protein
MRIRVGATRDSEIRVAGRRCNSGRLGRCQGVCVSVEVRTSADVEDRLAGDVRIIYRIDSALCWTKKKKTKLPSLINGEISLVLPILLMEYWVS